MPGTKGVIVFHLMKLGLQLLFDFDGPFEESIDCFSDCLEVFCQIIQCTSCIALLQEITHLIELIIDLFVFRIFLELLGYEVFGVFRPVAKTISSMDTLLLGGEKKLLNIHFLSPLLNYCQTNPNNQNSYY